MADGILTEVRDRDFHPVYRASYLTKTHICAFSTFKKMRKKTHRYTHWNASSYTIAESVKCLCLFCTGGIKWAKDYDEKLAKQGRPDAPYVIKT